MGQVLEKLPIDQAKEMFENVKDKVTEKVSELNLSEKFQSFDPLSYCRGDRINSEDRAQIFALLTDEQNNFTPEDTQPQKLRAKNKPKPRQPHFPIKQFHDLDQNTENILNRLDSQYGYPKDHQDFDYYAWQKYDPEEDDFYEYDQGSIEEDKIEIINGDNLDNLENVQVFQGEMDEETNKRNGYGLEASSKYVRIGWWRQGEFTGWGRESRRNQDVLEGKFVGGELNGKGKFVNARGDSYLGDFKNNLKHGEGVVNTQKIFYKGQFTEDKMNGIGEILFKQTGNSYKGEFKNGEISGTGQCTWRNGDYYEGNMEKGKRVGFGKYQKVGFDGKKSLYEGNYEDGQKSGQGKIIYPKGNKIFEGNFEKGRKAGQGSIIKDGKAVPVDINQGRVSVRK